MQYHKIDPVNGEYLSSRRPQIDGQGRIFGPAKNEVKGDLPTAQENKVRVWDGEKFVVVNDYRGQTAYQADGSATIITGLGELPEGSTLTPPPSPWHKWDGQGWVIDVAKKSEVKAIAEKIIDVGTAAKIATGIEINGVRVTLSSQTQFNLGTDHRIRESLVYPYRYRTDSGVYIDIQSADEFDQFFMAGRNFIRQCLDEGDAEKDALAEMSVDETYNFIKGEKAK